MVQYRNLMLSLDVHKDKGSIRYYWMTSDTLKISSKKWEPFKILITLYYHVKKVGSFSETKVHKESVIQPSKWHMCRNLDRLGCQRFGHFIFTITVERSYSSINLC